MNRPAREVSAWQAPALPLDERALAFLHESNAIEGIVCFDYRLSSAERLQGHVAAFVQSQKMARARRAMSALELCHWQQLIVLEQRQAHVEIPPQAVGRFRSGLVPYNVGVGHYVPPSFLHVPELMRAWMRDLRTHLMDESAQMDDERLADLCGDMLQRFEAIHPFVDGNGRVGRLIVNYLLGHWGRPIAVFRLDERDEFFAAHRSRTAMRRFMRQKIAAAEP
jgi:Fic family protein